jgi:hypothetical protein
MFVPLWFYIVSKFEYRYISGAPLHGCMKLLTFLSGDNPLLGVLVGENVLDVNAALRQGLGGTDFPKEASRELNMLSLLEMRGEGLNLVREAVAETRALDEDGTNGLRVRGVLHRLEDVRLIAPIPRPRKNIVIQL